MSALQSVGAFPHPLRHVVKVGGVDAAGGYRVAAFTFLQPSFVTCVVKLSHFSFAELATAFDDVRNVVPDSRPLL